VTSHQHQPYEVFADQAFISFLRNTPEVPAMMGIAGLPGLSDTQGRINDYSVQGVHDRLALLHSINNTHQSYKRETLTEAEQLSWDVFDFLLQYPSFEPWVGLAGEEFAFHSYPICHHDGAPSETFNVLANFHPIRERGDAENYLHRLEALPGMFRGLLEDIRYRDSMGLSPPRTSLVIVEQELKQLLQAGVHGSDLLQGFEQRLDDAKLIVPAQKQAYVAEANKLLSELYSGALPDLLEQLSQFCETASAEIGVWRLPEGEAYYRYCLERHTGSGLSPDEVYELGRQEVDRLKSELTADVTALGGGSGDLASSLTAILDTKQDGCQEQEQQRKQILEYYTALVAGAEQALRPHFGLYPDAPCQVRATPRHLEAKRTSTYYPPSATGDYPGTFELNLGQELNKAPSARHQLAYHETFPGHHLQLSLCQQFDHLPLFRRTFVFAAYLEGWAKYAERLPWELGIDTDPGYELRRKQGELISSSNLMLDTGIHHRRWSREQSVAFCQKEALLPQDFAEYLVDRITVTPGQTPSYALGLAKVRALRENMQCSLKERFKLPDFHDLFLKEGVLPLTVLSQHMQRGIAQLN